jgi:hypothetical protein
MKSDTCLIASTFLLLFNGAHARVLGSFNTDQPDLYTGYVSTLRSKIVGLEARIPTLLNVIDSLELTIESNEIEIDQMERRQLEEKCVLVETTNADGDTFCMLDNDFDISTFEAMSDGDIVIAGDATIGDGLRVLGSTTVEGKVTILGSTTVSKKLLVEGNVELQLKLGVDNNLEVRGITNFNGEYFSTSNQCCSFWKIISQTCFAICPSTGNVLMQGANNKITVEGTMDVKGKTIVEGESDLTGDFELKKSKSKRGSSGDGECHASDKEYAHLDSAC